MGVFLKLKWFFVQEKRAYLSGILVLVMVAILELIPTRVIGIVVDSIDRDELTSKSLLLWMILLTIVTIILYVLRYIWRIKIFGSALKLARQMRNTLYEHFTKMPASFYQRKRIGDLMAHATNDLQAIQQTAGNGVLTLVDSLTVGGFVVLVMAFINWKLAIISLLPMPLIAISTSYFGKLLHTRFRDAKDAFSDLNDKSQESINGIKVTKTFGQEIEDIESFRKLSEDVVDKNIIVAKIDSLFDPTIGLMAGISYFLAVAFGAKFVLEESMTIGELVSFTIYLGQLIWPMLAFGFLFNIVERGGASYDRIETLLAEKPQSEDDTDSIQTTPTGQILFKLNSFTYPGADTPALSNIHFTINKGETLGIVGKTGSGKTTLLKALIREFEHVDGVIYFGHHPITDYGNEAYRKGFGYVPQEHFLFSATISDNIAFAKAEASINDIEKAAKLAYIHDDIINFTDGYSTVVGERGVSLSGGQKQRISIARALILNPELLILDDSLSAVDAKTEEIILGNLRQNRLEKTTIITAHRLSSIQHANHIIVLENGEIIESGTHEQLMERDGWYKNMYVQQQLEELVEQGG